MSGAYYTIAVVGCGAAKQDKPAPAGEMYTSVLFRLSYEYAQAVGDDVVIASAKHGLLALDDVIEPYERRLVAAQALEWAAGFCAALWFRFQTACRADPNVTGLRVVLLAGRAYTDPLGAMMRYGEQRFIADEGIGVPPYTIEEPLRGMQIGQRLRWLRRQLDARVN